MPVAVVSGVRLYYEASGREGDPLVLVHGSWGDHHNWNAVVPALSQSFRVLTYDRRGHSQSERPPGQGSVREDVADLAGLLEALNLAPAHIVGNSFGGSIVLRLAGERPDLFRSLIVHEPPLFRLLEDESARRSMERMGAIAELLAADRIEEGARQFVETVAFGPGAWEQFSPRTRETFIFNAPTWLDEARDPDALTLDCRPLRNFSHPVLLTVGQQSAPFFPPVVSKIREALPHAMVKTFQGAGHVPHLSHPEAYVEMLRVFVRRAPPPS
jgi:pimeloyl-ACP methyl ester carboxylesterase